jgi:hypothetical protein
VAAVRRPGRFQNRPPISDNLHAGASSPGSSAVPSLKTRPPHSFVPATARPPRTRHTLSLEMSVENPLGDAILDTLAEWHPAACRQPRVQDGLLGFQGQIKGPQAARPLPRRDRVLPQGVWSLVGKPFAWIGAGLAGKRLRGKGSRGMSGWVRPSDGAEDLQGTADGPLRARPRLSRAGPRSAAPSPSPSSRRGGSSASGAAGSPAVAAAGPAGPGPGNPRKPSPIPRRATAART